MVPQERQPSGGLASGVRGLDHVLTNGVFAGRLVVQEQEVVANLAGSPERILAAELPDQILHLLGDGGPSGPLSGFPLIRNSILPSCDFTHTWASGSL